MSKPLAIDLFAGLGGWSTGLLAEGYDVVGFDIEQHIYGEHRYPAQLVVQDVLTLHGSQFRTAALIVASPPCQAYSYRAMPWKKARSLPPPCNALFEACFRIQREACAVAGRHIPLVVENVRGAQPWVGRARWNFGSFYLWGDVPALMPRGAGRKQPGINLSDIGFNVANAHQFAHMVEGVKIKRSDEDKRQHIGTKRKFASAMIAKIPEPLARHIGRSWYPRDSHFHLALDGSDLAHPLGEEGV